MLSSPAIAAGPSVTNNLPLAMQAVIRRAPQSVPRDQRPTTLTLSITVSFTSLFRFRFDRPRRDHRCSACRTLPSATERATSVRSGGCPRHSSVTEQASLQNKPLDISRSSARTSPVFVSSPRASVVTTSPSADRRYTSFQIERAERRHSNSRVPQHHL